MRKMMSKQTIHRKKKDQSDEQELTEEELKEEGKK